jgi:type I restriction enzyme S subunit
MSRLRNYLMACYRELLRKGIVTTHLMIKMQKIGSILTVSSGGTPNRKREDYYSEGTIPWVKTGDLKGKFIIEPKEYITSMGLKNSSAKLFPKNTVLVAMYGATIGACSILPIEAATNQACAALLPCPECDPSYLYFHFSSIKFDLIKKGVGGAQPNISIGILKNLEIPLPPLEEQKKIASILDAADDYRQKTKALIEKYDQLTQSLFLDMFGDPVFNPMGWESKKLGMVHKISSGGTPSRKNLEYYSNGTIPWVKTGELKGMYALSPSEYITEAALINSSAKLFPVNTLLIAMYGATIGACSILNIEAATNQACAALIPTNETDVIYEYFFFSLYKNELIKLGVGGAQPNISAGILKSLNVMYPPLQLQNQFAERVAQIEKQKQQAEESLAKADELFNSLLQRAFKGELTN